MLPSLRNSVWSPQMEVVPPSLETPRGFLLLVQKSLAQEPASLPCNSDSTSAQLCGTGKCSHLCNGNNISNYKKD